MSRAAHRNPGSLQLHPAGDLVPSLGRDQYASFLEDVAERGVQVPLEITAAGVVLDGRQRLRAALELGLDQVPVRIVAPIDEVDYMLRAAVMRRDLNPSQKAVVVLGLEPYRRLRAEAERRRLANLNNQPEVASLPPRGKTRDQAADWAGIGARTFQDAATVERHQPELLQRILKGETTASTAARQVRRRLRDSALPAPPPLPTGPFEVIYGDPPWQLGNPSSPHAPEQHYATLSTPAIAAHQLPAADDAVLFLWAVNSMLPEAIQVMTAWGFEFKTSMVWVKPSIKLGIWVRNRHELLLIGRRGNASPPEPEERVDSVIEAACGRHSEKPALVYELIERM